VAAKRQVVDTFEQQRQPVGRAHRREQRVEPGFERLVAKDPLAQLLGAVDRQLFVRSLDQRLESHAQISRGGRRRRQHQDRTGGGSLLDQPAGAPCQHVRLACARPAEDQERPTGVGDGRELSAIQAVQRSGHAR
jgi:hypothetical protein